MEAPYLSSTQLRNLREAASVTLLSVWFKGDFYWVFSSSCALGACQQMAECMMGGKNQLSLAVDNVNVPKIASGRKEQLFSASQVDL